MRAAGRRSRPITRRVGVTRDVDDSESRPTAGAHQRWVSGLQSRPRMSVVATPTGLEPATSAVTGRADGRWLSMGVAGPLEFAGLRAFETLGSRWVFSGLLLPQCCPTEIIFSRDGVEPAQLAAVV